MIRPGLCAFAILSAGCQVVLGIEDVTGLSGDPGKPSVGDAGAQGDAERDSDASPPGPSFVYEAENFVQNTPMGNHQWEQRTDTAGYSGEGFMETTPDTSRRCEIDDIPTCSPFMDYDISIPDDGMYFVYFRNYSPDAGADSVFWQLDGAPIQEFKTDPDQASWVWYRTDDAIAIAGGEHAFRIYMREDGQRVDQFAVTTDPAWMP